jgi:addiction module HigA family antidote
MDLRAPPGNRLERLKGELAGWYSIRINDQWRLLFRWQGGNAARLGWTRARLNELIKGKRGITAAAALDLAEALGTSPKLWMNLQATYDLDRAEKARHVA